MTPGTSQGTQNCFIPASRRKQRSVLLTAHSTRPQPSALDAYSRQWKGLRGLGEGGNLLKKRRSRKGGLLTSFQGTDLLSSSVYHG